MHTAEKIWLSSPHMSGKEEEYVRSAFEANWVSPAGPNIDGFEKDIQEYLGENVYACALTSGTAAIHLGLILLGVQRDDEVICQSLTFAASANPIVYLGAVPVFVDSERTTWNMDPQLLEEAILDRRRKGKTVKAIIVVDLFGMPAQMHDIYVIGQKYSIPVLEDAAEALGSSIENRKCGTFADIAALSFNGNKIITTSGGGAIVSKNRKWIETAKFLSTQAKDPAPHYEHSQTGYNYRLSNICAGIGRGQMEVIDERVNQRRNNYFLYKSHLESFPQISFIDEQNGFFSNRWLTAILIDPKTSGITREVVRTFLANENIESRPFWKPMHLQPIFRHTAFYGSGLCEKLFDNGLCLPSGSNLSATQLEIVINNISELLNSNNEP